MLERQLMVERQLRGRDVVDERVLEAMARVPRELFVPEFVRDRAYEDAALPIGATRRPRSTSCSYSVRGSSGAAAATAIASNGARSGRPRVPSPTFTSTRS